MKKTYLKRDNLWHVSPTGSRFPCLEPGWEKELASLVECTVNVKVQNESIDWDTFVYDPISHRKEYQRRLRCSSRVKAANSQPIEKPPENISSESVIASGLKWSGDEIVTLANDAGELVTIPTTSLAVKIFLRDGWKKMDSHSAGPVTGIMPTAIPSRSETLSSGESGKMPSND